MNIEKLATSYLTELISTTDTLDPFISKDDREPSWDGNIYIKSNTRGRKTSIEKIPVQVKGCQKDVFPAKISFRMSVDDIDNYLRDGGVILFVVYISRDGKNKKVYYSSLLPIKIRLVKGQNKGRKTIPIDCDAFPTDEDDMTSICKNFYTDMQKQRSFAMTRLPTAEELDKQGILEKITMSVVAIGKQKDDVGALLRQNPPYLYAKIKGIATPQPLEMLVVDFFTQENVACSVGTGGKVFYTSAKRERHKSTVDLCFGKSFRIVGDGQKIEFSFSLVNQLPDTIIDTEFIISVIETGSIQLNGNDFPITEAKTVWSSKLQILRDKLAYYKKVKAIIDTLGLEQSIDVELTTNNDYKYTEWLYQGIVKGRVVSNLNPEIRPGVEYCVSDIRQSQEWHCRNRAEKGLNALLTSAPEARDGMRASA